MSQFAENRKFPIAKSEIVRISTQKCTEPVTPSSGLPTDVRRSDCRSEGHQPQALRARCNRHSTGSECARQGVRPGLSEQKSRNLRLFLYASSKLRSTLGALERRDQQFAEPGALSSTPPGDLPLPRTASREGFVLLTPRARRRRNSMLASAGRSRASAHVFPANCECLDRALERTWLNDTLW